MKGHDLLCTRFYVARAQFAPLITRVQMLELANSIMMKLDKPLFMSGGLRPTDVAEIFCTE